MCLHVSSASSGPRERDSSFTLENSSLRGETEGEDTAQTRAPGRTAVAGSSAEPCWAGHNVQCPNVRSGFSLRNRSRLFGHPTEAGVQRLDPREAAAAKDAGARGAGSGLAGVSPPRRCRHSAATGGQVKGIGAANFIQDTRFY